MVGSVDEDTKAWLLHHATALAYPSLDEGFGFPILEAQSVGVPVVATRAGSIPEIAGGGAELVSLGDVDALAGALARVVDDEDRRRELVAAGRANVARFSWSATADALVRLYRRVKEDERERRLVVLARWRRPARFLRGVVQVVDPRNVVAVVNTGDDTVLHGLSISPDFDTITYTLAGAIDPRARVGPRR